MHFYAHLTFFKIYFNQFGNSFYGFQSVHAQNLLLQVKVLELNNSNLTNYVFICNLSQCVYKFLIDFVLIWINKLKHLWSVKINSVHALIKNRKWITKLVKIDFEET
jgi:hypothetical protein